MMWHWYRASKPTGSYVMWVAVAPTGGYGELPYLSDDSDGKVREYLKMHDDEQYHLDMGRKIIWYEGFDVLHLEYAENLNPVANGCPTCGNRGTFIRMALCCPLHGFFGGI